MAFPLWAIVPPILSWASLGSLAISLLIGSLAYLAALRAGGAYGELLRAAYDLHRFALYEQLRWQPPTAAADEKALGERLTVYLFRGEAPEGLTFVAPATRAREDLE
jgi:hypothetical protein